MLDYALIYSIPYYPAPAVQHTSVQHGHEEEQGQAAASSAAGNLADTAGSQPMVLLVNQKFTGHCNINACSSEGVKVDFSSPVPHRLLVTSLN